MATTTAIEWTDKTYNPWIGCTKVSPGCTNCYAETFALQKGFVNEWGKTGIRRITQTAPEVLKWNQEAIENGTRYTVFCASLGDVFEENAQLVEARQDLWNLVKQTPFLDWMILTKRPENITSMLPEDWGNGYDHVSLMTSTEDQECFDKRVPILRKVKSQRRALSIEPLLGPIVIPKGALKGIDLVIVGGESGTDVRPMNPEWVRMIRDACARDRVDFFFKQWGNWGPDASLAEPDLSNAAVFIGNAEQATFLEKLPADERQAFIAQPNAQIVYHAKSKKSTGKELDGVTHTAHPYKLNHAAGAATTTTPAKLTEDEARELREFEETVTTGLEHFWKVGEALRQIRDKGLYRETHETFESYCLERWSISRPEAYRQIGAAEVIRDLSIKDGVPVPATASQTRPLMKLKTASQRRNTWAKVCAGGATITAEVVEKEVAKVLETKPATRPTAKTSPVAPAKPAQSVRNQIKSIIADLELALGPTGRKGIAKTLKRLRELVEEVKN